MASNFKDKKRTEERKRKLLKTTAETISKMSEEARLFDYECEVNSWDNSIIDLYNESLQKLGEALAGLVLWDDDDPEDK